MMKKAAVSALVAVLTIVMLLIFSSCGSDGGGTTAASGEIVTDLNGSVVNAGNSSADGDGQSADYSAELDRFLKATADASENFSFTLMSYKYDKSEPEKGDTATLLYCKEGWLSYANDGQSCIMFVNDGKKQYSVDIPKKTKFLVAEGENASNCSWDVTFAKYKVMLTAHTMYPKEYFTRGETDKIAGRDCVKYTVDATATSTGSKMEYWIDSETGLLLKSITATELSGVKSITSWEITEFNIGSCSLDSYLDYTDK